VVNDRKGDKLRRGRVGFSLIMSDGNHLDSRVQPVDFLPGQSNEGSVAD
jgi:hypothetical protein